MARSSLIPGFRFHPTDVELVMYYLKRKLLGKKITVNAIAEVNIYDFSPWDLPDKSSLRSGDLEWYFFCPKAKKYSSGSRSNRSTETGFWKATGKDRNVKYNERNVASIKTLVFHLGHAGKGERTDWVMHEYKMEDEHLASAGVVQDMYVLCKVFKKSGSGPRNGAQYGAPFDDEKWGDDLGSCIDSRVAVGLVGASNTTDNKHKGLAATNITEPGSSIVTFSPNTPTNMLNVGVSQNTHGLSVTEPGSFSFDLPVNADVMFFEDLIMGSEEVEANKEDGIYDNLVNLFDLDELKETNFKTDGADYTLDNLLTLDDLTADSTDFKMDGADYKLDNLLPVDDLNANSTDFKTDGADYTLDKVLMLDDLDFDLTDFKTDGADYTPGNFFTLDVDSTIFKNDRADYRLDKLFTPDDLDVDLQRFYVD